MKRAFSRAHQKINEKIVFEVVNPTSNIKKKSGDKNLNVIAIFYK